MKTIPSALLLTALSLLASPQGLTGIQNRDAVPIQIRDVRGGVYMVSGAGGNVAAFLGGDGIFLVDAAYGELVPRILETIRAAATEAGASSAVRFLVNTHWHFDHTGGNEAFAEAGAILMGHEGVLRALSETRIMEALGGQQMDPAPPDARPILTFNDRVNLSWNDDLIHLVHMPGAHSDGDVIVHFRDADVIHVGDLYFNGLYPYIDVDYGGSLEGMVRALDEVLSHSRERSLFIPGHGPLATREDLEGYAAMLRTIAQSIRGMVEEGLSREEVVAAKPTAEFDGAWGQPEGFAHPDTWAGLVYDGMVRADAGGR